MKAVTIKEVGGSGKAEVEDVAEPTLRPGYIKVRTVAVAVNPIDWKNIAFMGQAGLRLGGDYSGIVEEIGPECHTTLKKGDPVLGGTHGANSTHKEDGCFAEVCLNRDGILGKKPESISFEEAASFTSGIITGGKSLYHLGLPLPSSSSTDTSSNDQSPTILIYGGSTAMGMLAIQYAKLSGYKILTAASPKNFPLITSLGASACYDYHSPTIGDDIRSATNNTLAKALDCIGSPESVAICAAALSSSLPTPTPNPHDNGKSQSAHYVSLGFTEFPRKDAVTQSFSAYTALGEAFVIMNDQEVPFVPEDYEFGKKFYEISTRLIGEGKLKPVPIEVRGGGLEGVLEGIADLRDGKVSARKLVYRVAETPGL